MMADLEYLHDRLNKSKCHMFCILISKVISGLRVLRFSPVYLNKCCFCLAKVVVMPVEVFYFGLIWLVSVRWVTVQPL